MAKTKRLLDKRRELNIASRETSFNPDGSPMASPSVGHTSALLADRVKSNLDKRQQEVAQQQAQASIDSQMSEEEKKKQLVDSTVATNDRKKIIDEAVNQNKSIEEIATQAGLSTDEVKSYTDLYHKGYKAKNPLEAIGSFLKENIIDPAVAVPATVGESIATINPSVREGIQLDVDNMQKRFQEGKITKAALEEEYNKKYGNINATALHLKVTDNGLEKQNTAEAIGQFAGKTIEGGTALASLTPAGGAYKAATVGIKTAGQTSLKAGIKAGTVLSAKEAGIYGSATTASDVANGQFSLDKAALNYLSPLALGTVSRSVGTAGGRQIAKMKGVKLGKDDVVVKSVVDKAAKTIDQLDPTDPDYVVKSSQILQDIQSAKYSQSVKEKIRSKLMEEMNPYNAAARLDTAYAKSKGMRSGEVHSWESLQQMMRDSANSEAEARQFIDKKMSTGLSLKDLITKSGENTPQSHADNVYLNALYDLEARSKPKGAKTIQAEYTAPQLEAQIKSYETANPGAKALSKTAKELNNEALDIAVSKGLIEKSTAEFVKNSSAHAVPLERIFPDDLVRPQMQGKALGTISKQTVLQRLDGNSDIPLGTDYQRFQNRIQKAVAQGNRARVAKRVYELHKMGILKKASVQVTPGLKAVRTEVKGDIQVINKATRILEGKMKLSSRDSRQLATEINNLEKQGLKISLKKTGTSMQDVSTPNVGTLGKVSGKTNNVRAVIKSLVQTDDATLTRVINKVATRDARLAAKLSEIQSYKTRIDSQKAVKGNLKEVVANFEDDPARPGQQVISGFDNGEPFKLEITDPQLARMLTGADSRKLETMIKIAAEIQRPFKNTWTGMLQPIFAGVSTFSYDLIPGVVNSKAGFKTLAPSAWKEGIKSVFGKSELDMQLRKSGFLPFGGSRSSSTVAYNAESISAARSFSSRIKYNLKHPERLNNILDVFGGKMAQLSRIRVAKARYDLEIRKGFTPAQALSDAKMEAQMVMPDFATNSNLVRSIDAFVPFFGATVAGGRSFNQGFLRDPKAFLIRTTIMAGVPATAVAAYSLMSSGGQEYYQDMINSKKEYILDNNLIIALPGAHKDPNTGEWIGIKKIPISPEIRSLNRAVWKSVIGAQTGKNGIDAGGAALAIFDFFTAQIRNPSENPLITSTKIMAGENPRTGEQLINGSMADLPKDEQTYKTTSNAGRFVGKLLGTSPIQGDALINQFGIPGAAITREGGDVVAATEQRLKSTFSGGYGQKASNSFYEAYTPVKARRDKAYTEVRNLKLTGKFNRAADKAKEFNDSLTGKFSKSYDEFGKTDAWDSNWTDMVNSLYIDPNSQVRVQ